MRDNDAMSKKLLIGVGGTGLEVLRCLRRRIVEDYPEQGLRQFPRLGFLYIDTDPNAVVVSEDNRKRWEVMGQSIQLTPAEFAIIQAPAIGRILDNLPNYPQIRGWLPVQQLKGLDAAAKDTPGAQQIRALGRVIFTLESDKIRQRVASILDSLPEDPQGGPTEIYVACSLSGGTGGGMFLDLAYSLRRWTNDRAETTGYLVMPDLNQEASRGRRYIANAYGSLMDLNYFSLRSRVTDGKSVPVGFQLPADDSKITDQNPFDFCYLMSTRNQSGVALSLNTIPDMISHRLYMTLDNAIVADVKSMMNNGAMQRGRFLSDPVNGNLVAQAFSTFGLSTIQYPTEQIVEIVSHRLAEALVASWMDAPQVDNVSERVSQHLPDLSLIDDVFWGNRDIFQGANDFGSIANDVEKQLNESLSKLPFDNRATELNRIFGNFLDEFRGGLKQFYRGREDNLEGAVQTLTRKIRAYAVDSILASDLGLWFGLASVDEIIRQLELKQQETNMKREQIGPRVRNSRSAVTAAIGQVTNAENAIIRRDSKLKETLTKVKATLSFNLTGQVEERALEYAVKLLGRLTQNLGVLRNELAEWSSAMTVVRNLLDREVKRRAESLESLQKSSNQFNGAILFNSNRVEQIYRSLNQGEALQFMRDRIKGDVLSLGEHAEQTVDALFRFAADWLTRVSSVRVAHKNVADQLLEDYPGPDNAERRQLLDSTYRRSAAFLEFDQGEMEIYRGQVGHAYEFDRTTATERAGIMDHDQNRFRNVALVRAEIGKATGLSSDAVRTISDIHQVVFISERTAFPLRILRDARALREAYRAHAAQKGSLPLLLQKDYDPPMGDLMLVSQAEVERQHRSEANFLIGWTLGWVSIEQNMTDNRPEARYRFVEAGAEQYVKVGDNREAALAYFVAESPESLALRKRLSEAVERHMSKMDNYAKRAEFSTALGDLLLQLKAQMVYGEENLVYQQYNRIRQYIMTEFHLPVIADAPPAPSQQQSELSPGAYGKTTASNVAEVELARFVGLFANQTKGNLTEKMLALVKNKQQALKVPDSRCAAILEQALSPFRSQTSSLEEYRELLAALMEGGDLTEESVIELVGFQADHNITPEQAERVEQEVKTKLGRV